MGHTVPEDRIKGREGRKIDRLLEVCPLESDLCPEGIKNSSKLKKSE